MSSQNSGQPAHLHSLIRIFPGYILDSPGCKVLSCRQWRLWSELGKSAGWSESLLGAHVRKCVFWSFNSCHAEWIEMPCPLNFQPIRLLHLGCWYKLHILNGKQCRSRSVGFFRSQLIWIYTVFKARVFLGSAGQWLKVDTRAVLGVSKITDISVFAPNCLIFQWRCFDNVLLLELIRNFLIVQVSRT